MFSFFQTLPVYPYTNPVYFLQPNIQYYSPLQLFSLEQYHDETNNQVIESTSSKQELKNKKEKSITKEVQQKKLKRRKRKRILKKKIQNPHRNVFTNIGNQIIGFILNKNKSIQILHKIIPNITQEYLEQFYSYMRKLKLLFQSYMNLTKFNHFFFGINLEFQKPQFHAIIRRISYFYLNKFLICSFVTSKKLSKELKLPHINSRRILLNLLKNIENEISSR